MQDLVYNCNEGQSAETFLDMFSTRALALIHKFFEFYLEHQPELDAYVGRCDAQMARRRPAAPRGPELAELRRRLAAKQGAGA